MKTGTTIVTTVFAIASLPLMAQQPSATSQPESPATQQTAPAAAPVSPSRSAASPAATTVEMSSIDGELVSKLDSKTAKIGDSVVLQTKSPAKTADGTEIPKGSKLVGHVIGAQPSGAAGENSQVALQIDQLELKGGQSVPVRSQIQSISPSGGAASDAMSAPPASSSPNPGAAGNNSTGGATGAPQAAPGYSGAAPARSEGPAPGTVVAKTGQIAISTTSIPGVLLANNAPGQQDPRMSRASSILVGAKQDIQLESGTRMVVGVAAAGNGAR